MLKEISSLKGHSVTLEKVDTRLWVIKILKHYLKTQLNWVLKNILVTQDNCVTNFRGGFEINKNALEVCIKRNRKEFESNGLRVLSYAEMKEFCDLHSVSYNKKSRSMVLMTKRTL